MTASWAPPTTGLVIIAGGQPRLGPANYGGLATAASPVAALSTPTPRRWGVHRWHPGGPVDDLPAIVADHQAAIGIIATLAAAAQTWRPHGRRRGQLDPELRPRPSPTVPRACRCAARPGGGACQILSRHQQRRSRPSTPGVAGAESARRVLRSPTCRSTTLYPVNLRVTGAGPGLATGWLTDKAMGSSATRWCTVAAAGARRAVGRHASGRGWRPRRAATSPTLGPHRPPAWRPGWSNAWSSPPPSTHYEPTPCLRRPA